MEYLLKEIEELKNKLVELEMEKSVIDETLKEFIKRRADKLF